jgi:peptidoglycan/xylan/chitin deacetylase (PgdA/CDA1 family)
VNLDAARTALLAAPEATGGRHSVDGRLARRLTPRIPPPLIGDLQRVRSKLGPARFSAASLRPGIAARRSLLGTAAEGPPRVLLRVDEYPYATSLDHPESYGIEPSTRFHSVLADAGIPYLMAIVPQLVYDPLNPEGSGGRALNDDERGLIRRMAADGVTFAAHGLTHRTRDVNPRRRSEFRGLTEAEAGELADDSLRLLGAIGVRPRVFVPPFNRFGPEHYRALTTRFDVVTGGPESIPLMGPQPSPRWLGQGVYFPCYPPFYGRARGVQDALQRLVDQRPGTWIQATLHLSWEVDDGLEDMRRLADWLAPYAVSWEDFLDAVRSTRDRAPRDSKAPGERR